MKVSEYIYIYIRRKRVIFTRSFRIVYARFTFGQYQCNAARRYFEVALSPEFEWNVQVRWGGGYVRILDDYAGMLNDGRVQWKVFSWEPKRIARDERFVFLRLRKMYGRCLQWKNCSFFRWRPDNCTFDAYFGNFRPLMRRIQLIAQYD